MREHELSPDLAEAFSLIDAAAEGVMDFAGPVTQAEIEAAEAVLGVAMPASYRSFVARYGEGVVGSSEIYGLIPGERSPGSRLLSVVGRTLDLRGYGLPYEMIPVYSLGNGEDYALDLCGDGEACLRAWGVGAGSDRVGMDVVEPSFPAFLLKLAREATP